jgi:hypothetical protein
MNMSSELPPKPPPLGESGGAASYSPLGIAAIGFGVVNLLYVPMMVSLRGPDHGAMFLAMLAAGPLLAQFGILPAWLVWGDGPFWRRLVIHWSLAIVLSLAWLCGMAMGMAADGPIVPAEMVFRQLVMLFLCLPAVSLGIEGPMWLLRFFFRWRITRKGASPDATRPLAIRDFLWGMAVISAALAAVRAAGAVDYSPSDAEMWVGMAIAVGSAALVSLVVMPLFAWCLLGTKNVGSGVAVIVVVTIFAAFVILAIIASMMGSAPPNGEPFAALFVFLASASASIGGALALARGAGYRLEIGRSGSAAAFQADEAS